MSVYVLGGPRYQSESARSKRKKLPLPPVPVDIADMARTLFNSSSDDMSKYCKSDR